MSSSTLPGPAHSASRAALNAALNDTDNDPSPSPDPDPAPAPPQHPPPNGTNGVSTATDDDLPEDGEIQELDLAAHAEEIRTVFSDSKNFNVKHPLYSSWTLWFDSAATKGRNLPQTPSISTPATPLPQTPSFTSAAAQGWMEDIKKVISFDSVEEFWGLYNNIVPPSQLPQKANYYLFKDNIIPAWEDDANKNGGKWSIQLPKEKNRLNVDRMWLYTMLAAIGETFDPLLSLPHPAQGPAPTGLITGVILSTRQQFYRISIWTRLAPSSSTPGEDDELRKRIETIGRHFKTQVLGYAETQKLGGPLATEVEFLSHKDSERKGKGKKIIV
ncbi:eukaryotic translation initiation factor 4E class I [Ramaria rubella]|nr:eukaryotic translation initiation factor 4E class I [Ramaria rubella]